MGWGIRGLGKDKDGDGMTDEGRGARGTYFRIYDIKWDGDNT